MPLPRLNVVYANNNMKEQRIGPLDIPGVPAEIVWSREEEPGAHVVLYWNSYTFHPRLARENPDAVRVMYVYEPVVVDPFAYSPKVWARYDHILTCIDPLVQAGPPFCRFPIIYYDLPFSPGYGVEAHGDHPEALLERPRKICQVCGDKFSLISCELYSERRDAAEWFAAHGMVPMDVFGIPGMTAPNYRGPAADKFETLKQYRYALCFENTYHPTWSRGYVTEKIFDCMSAGTLPVYYGASDIEQYVDRDCFIDFREFDGYAELDTFLREMSDDIYLAYVRRMQAFVTKHAPRERYSCHRLYEKTMELAGWPRPEPPASYPPGYRQSLTTFTDRLRYAGMWFALKCYRFIYPVFAVMRWCRWAITRLR